MGRVVIFFCSMFGVVIVSMVVVSVMNLFEMNNLESKAFTVIKKLRVKKRMKDKASKVIGKLGKLHLNLRKGNNIEVKEVFKLNNMIKDFKRDLRY